MSLTPTPADRLAPNLVCQHCRPCSSFSRIESYHRYRTRCRNNCNTGTKRLGNLTLGTHIAYTPLRTHVKDETQIHAIDIDIGKRHEKNAQKHIQPCTQGMKSKGIGISFLHRHPPHLALSSCTIP